MSYVEINNRYSELAGDTCCLSCGNAINYSAAKKGETCVDLGSGRGTDVLRLAEEVGESGIVYGIDISEGMILKAQKTSEKSGIKNAKFIQSALESIPLERNSVDLIISNCTINHASQKQKVWNEIARVLKDGGRFVVSDIYSLSPVPQIYKDNPEFVAECWAGAVTKDEYLGHLKNAGLDFFEIIEESKPYSKGEIEVSSFTVKGVNRKSCCCT